MNEELNPKVAFDAPHLEGELDVFAYLDFRAFLRDFYLVGKRDRKLSYRSFSQQAGLRSPNYLKLVIDGQRNLSDPMAERFASTCGLSGAAARYFVALVKLGQAEGLAERSERHAALSRFRAYRRVHQLDIAQGAYHSKWYLPAIREMVALPHFREDPTWIAAHLEPPIKPAEASDALGTLLELNLLARDDDGRLHQVDSNVSTGPEALHSMHVANFHRTMMNKAYESIDLVPRNERDISSVTVTVGPNGVALLKERLIQLRQEILAFAQQESDPTQVVHIGLQLFPLTREVSDPTSSPPPNEEKTP